MTRGEGGVRPLPPPFLADIICEQPPKPKLVKVQYGTTRHFPNNSDLFLYIPLDVSVLCFEQQNTKIQNTGVLVNLRLYVEGSHFKVRV